METELVERLMDLKEGLARIDSRTEAIHENQEKLGDALIRHEERDRLDFKDVNDRVTRVERKQNWILGVVASSVFGITIIIGLFKGLFSS